MSDTSPPMWGPSSGRRWSARHGRAIVAGFGVVGRRVAAGLGEAGLEVTLIEMNTQTIENQRDRHEAVVAGDVRDEAVLIEAGVGAADVLVLTVPDEHVAVEACRVARQINPTIYIAARTNFFSKGLAATQHGADAVVVEEVVTAEAMRRAVVDQLDGSAG